MHYSICPGLNTDIYKHETIGFIDTDRNCQVPDLSGGQGKHYINSSKSDNEKTACSILSVNNLRRYGFAFQKAIEH